MRPGTPGFVGDRLREARQARGLSITALAGLLPGLSKQSISAYELNEATPHPDHAVQIADLLRLPLAFFLDAEPYEDDSPVYWRSLAAATKSARTSVRRKYDWLRRIVRYLSQYVAFPDLRLPSPLGVRDPVEISGSMIELAAKTTRQFFGLGNAPIDNVTWLLENHGLIIGYADFDAATLDSFSQVCSDGHAYALINHDHGTAVRYRFDLAHELGHMVLHRTVEPGLFTNATRNPVFEKQAHDFAREFLMPSESFARTFRIPTIDGLKLMKQTWKASMQACLMQAKHLGLVTDVQEQRIWRSFASRGWRRNEPLDDVFVAEQPELLRNAFSTVLESGISRQQILDDLPYNGDEIEDLCGLEPGTLVTRERGATPTLVPAAAPPAVRRDRGADILTFERNRRPNGH